MTMSPFATALVRDCSLCDGVGRSGGDACRKQDDGLLAFRKERAFGPACSWLEWELEESQLLFLSVGSSRGEDGGPLSLPWGRLE
jgi:hypothetical protein